MGKWEVVGFVCCFVAMFVLLVRAVTHQEGRATKNLPPCWGWWIQGVAGDLIREVCLPHIEGCTLKHRGVSCPVAAPLGDS
jgi:hypothetical protein